MKKLIYINAVAALLIIASAARPAHADNDDRVSCQRYAEIPVALASGQPAKYTVSGELCATEDERRAGTTVQLLIHGATYNHKYWDFGRFDGTRYSYARDIAAHGFPAFALDEIGAGDSSHPPSEQLTTDAAAHVAHEIVQGLRSGFITGIPFGKVIIMGHSLGSVVVWEEAINYRDVDGVIVTGAAHSITTKFLTSNALYPADKDPRFAHTGLDAGYLTTIPGTRTELYFVAPDFNPAILPVDEERKDLVAATELNTGLPIVTSTATLAIHVPVLTIVGGNDFTTCGPNPQGGNFDCSSGAIAATQEAPFYSRDARIHACIVPGSGHDVSLAVDHDLQVADAAAWSAAFVGQRNIGDRDDFENRRDFDASDRSLPWNDDLPWNCGGLAEK